MMRLIVAWALILALGAPAGASPGTPPPSEFAGVALGTTVAQLKALYPEARRHPESDKDFTIYVVPELKGLGVKSPAAFSFYRGRLVGGQILLDSEVAAYWLDRMRSRYGPPDGCKYCDYPDMATARWRWPNGTTIAILSGGMLDEFTQQGLEQRQAWIARGDQPPAAAAEAALEEEESVAQPPAAPPPAHRARKRAVTHARVTPAPTPPPTRWHKLYALSKRRLEEFFGRHWPAR